MSGVVSNSLFHVDGRGRYSFDIDSMNKEQCKLTRGKCKSLANRTYVKMALVAVGSVALAAGVIALAALTAHVTAPLLVAFAAKAIATKVAYLSSVTPMVVSGLVYSSAFATTALVLKKILHVASDRISDDYIYAEYLIATELKADFRLAESE